MLLQFLYWSNHFESSQKMKSPKPFRTLQTRRKKLAFHLFSNRSVFFFAWQKWKMRLDAKNSSLCENKINDPCIKFKKKSKKILTFIKTVLIEKNSKISTEKSRMLKTRDKNLSKFWYIFYRAKKSIWLKSYSV